MPTSAQRASRSEAQVIAVRHSVASDRIRVVVQFDAPVQYVAGTASDPYRIFFDLQGARPTATLASKTFIGDPLLPRIRVAQYRPGITRLVLDVDHVVPYAVSSVPDPPRLVIDVMRNATLAQARSVTVPTSPAVVIVAPPRPADRQNQFAKSQPPPAPAVVAPPSAPAVAPRPAPAAPAVGAQPAASPVAPQDSKFAARFDAGASPDPGSPARYLQAAQQGAADAQYHMGDLYMSGRGLPRDPAEAAKWYTRAAQQGHARAASNLGVLYANGWGVPQSDADAVTWFRKAADEGDPGGQNNLGAMYINGRGVAPSDVLGAKWVYQAAQQGVPEAQYGLGTLYANGRGVPRDDAQAVKWLQAAAAQHYAPAQLALGKLYLASSSVPRDYGATLKLFQSADLPEAWYQMGLLHQQGLGVPRSDAEAVVWFLKAAERGLPQAQFAIGRVYQDRDPVEAYSWFAISAASGDPDGVAAMNSLAPRMTAQQLAEAQQRALGMAQPRH